jgi:mitochondrial fission protein ELM1
MPHVWLLMGDRAGDNSQILALCEALDWPFEIKRLVYTPYERFVNLPITSTLAGVDRGRSSPLEAPWPDLVISAGRRNEPVARWIQRQAAGQKHVRLVHVGRPWAPLPWWDLVVTTPQYRLPDLPNVLQNECPLHRITPERLAEAALEWKARVDRLPRPYIALLAGGNSGPYPFDRPSGERLADLASTLAERTGGSLLVSTSARTPEETTEALFAGIRCPAYMYRWEPDAPENPYFGFLGLADQLIVTADSVSMMAEACATGHPVYLYDTGEGVNSMRFYWERGEKAEGHKGWRRFHRYTMKAFIYRQGMKWGPTRWTRDIRIVQQRLVESGRAAWLGSGTPDADAPPLRDVANAVDRVRALFELPPLAEHNRARAGAL